MKGTSKKLIKQRARLRQRNYFVLLILATIMFSITISSLELNALTVQGKELDYCSPIETLPEFTTLNYDGENQGSILNIASFCENQYERIYSICFFDSYAVLATGINGLFIMDVSDNANPEIISQVNTHITDELSWGFIDVCYSDGYVYA